MDDIIQHDAVKVARAWAGDLSELDGATIAISGASGLIGRHLVAILLALAQVRGVNVQVVAMGRDRTKLVSAFETWHDDPRLRLAEADVCRENDWPPEATHLIHAASPATPRLFAADPVGVIRANVLGTLAALQAAARSGAYVSLISTMEIYGAVPRSDESVDIEITEDTMGLVNPLDIRSAYPESKRLSETLIMAYAAQYGVPADIVRVSHTYGPGTNADDDRVQVDFVKRAVSDQPIILKSDGSLRRHYTYAADSAAAVLVILATHRNRSHPEAFNVADNASRVSIRELAELALTVVGRDPSEVEVDIPPQAGEFWSKTPGGIFLCTTKLDALGWAPKFTLAEGLSHMADYLRQSPPGVPGVEARKNEV